MPGSRAGLQARDEDLELHGEAHRASSQSRVDIEEGPHVEGGVVKEVEEQEHLQGLHAFKG